MRAVLAILTLALSLAGPATGANRQVEGHVSLNGSQLALVDGFALRGPRGERVTLHLYPVEIGPQDITAARSGQAWAVALRKPSPDPQRWDWCPSVQIDVRSANAALDGRATLAFVGFMFNGLDRRNHTINLTRSGEQARATVTALSFDTASGQEYVNIRTRANGLSYDGDSVYGWRLRARLPVYPAPPAEPPADR